MKLLIEAGSTKTDWALIIADKVIERSSGQGLNPVTDPDFDIKLSMLFEGVKDKGNIRAVHYYGAGCVNTTINDNVRKKIGRFVKAGTQVHVHDDMLGACRAVSSGHPSLVCILGTGSNICAFDGENIIDRVKSCGYLLGDEGSGFRMGQGIYLALVRKSFSPKVEQRILDRFGLNEVDLVPYLYGQANPRSFLAALSTAHDLLDTEAADIICSKTFEPLFSEMILPLHLRNPEPIAFVGSMAFHFEEFLKQKLEEYNLIGRCFEKTPMNGLIAYHQEKD